MSRKCPLTFIICISLLAVRPHPTATAGEPKAGPPPFRLLFAGSSSTYWNDLPGEVARLVSGNIASQPGRPVTAELVGRSGDDIRVYLSPDFKNYQYGVRPGQTFLDKIRDEKFDVVSLQVVCQFILRETDGDGVTHAAAISKYCDAIRAAGGEPLFYEMGWGQSEREAEGRQRILELARTNRVRLFAPCSSAWSRVDAQRPDLELQHPRDKSHPGDLGHFLNLACFYAALTETSPEGKLPREFHVWPHFSKEEKEQRRSELEAAFEHFRPNDYQARLPDWMRRNAGAGLKGRIAEPDALALEKIAWETWRSVQSQLGTRF